MEITEEQKLLLQVATLAIAPLPQDFSENCRRAWKAFELGRDYQKLQFLTPMIEDKDEQD